MNLRIAAYGLLQAALLALIFWRSPALQPGLAVALLAALGLGLQLASVPLPGFGYFNSAFAPLMALALLPGAGPGLAAAVLLGGVLLRSLLYFSTHRPRRTVCESLADLVPASAALAVVALAGEDTLKSAALGLSVYIPLALLLPGMLLRESGVVESVPWLQHRKLTGLHAVSVGLLGPVLTYLTQANPWFGLWLLPVLIEMHQTARIDLVRLELLDREQLQSRERESQVQLVHTRVELGETSRALDMETQERRLLQQLTCSLADSPDLESLLGVIVRTTVRLVPCQSVAVFVADGERLVPAAHLSPFAERLEAEALARLGEPLVEQCWRSSSVAVGAGQNLFPGEKSAVALPMQREAVLYVGRPARDEFVGLERQYLLAIAGAGGLGIQSARRFQEQQQALELHAQAHARLAVWVERLSFLLQSARHLSSDLSLDQIADRLQELLSVTLPHQAGALRLGTRPARTWPPEFWTPERTEALQELSEVVARNGLPLLVEDPSTFRGPSLGSGFMACPVEGGSVVLVGAFTREQMDVLALLAYQAAAAVAIATLHQEVVHTQAQLVQSSKLAAVGQLAAGVAHELNTPLCAEQLAIEMARMYLEMGKHEAILEQLQTAQGANARGRDIIAKLLYYSREGAAGQVEADLNDVVRDTLELLGNQLRLDGVQLETKLAPELPRIAMNCTEIQQAITNLLLNARDAVLLPEAASRQVQLSTSADEKELRVTVTDDGPGMDEAVLSRAFEPFFTTKEVGKGTGLGLSVSREIVTRHGGELSAVSAPGQGARFTLTLPLR